MVKLMALRDIYGSYGNKNAGEVFETDDETALSLETRGLAQRHHEPARKMMPAPQNKMQLPLANKSSAR